MLDRLKAPETQGRKVSQGFSLLRRCYDENVVAKSAELQARHRILSVLSDDKGRNRLAVHTLASGELERPAQLQVLGGLGLRKVLGRALTDVPALMTRRTLTVAEFRMRQDLRNMRGKYFLEAMFTPQGVAELQEEIDGIKASFESWAEDGDPTFTWSERVSPHLGIAATGSLASKNFVDQVEQTANEIFQPPFQLELTTTQLTLPKFAS